VLSPNEGFKKISRLDFVSSAIGWAISLGARNVLTRETMLSSTSWLLPNITFITFITLLTLVSIESIAKRFTHPAHVAST
jgi:hypothetical protein